MTTANSRRAGLFAFEETAEKALLLLYDLRCCSRRNAYQVGPTVDAVSRALGIARPTFGAIDQVANVYLRRVLLH